MSKAFGMNNSYGKQLFKPRIIQGYTAIGDLDSHMEPIHNLCYFKSCCMNLGIKRLMCSLVVCLN